MFKIKQQLAIAFLAALALAGCASGPDLKSMSPEDAAKTRAEQRWSAMMAADWDKAYSFFSPGYRELNSLDDFKERITGRKINWTSAEAGKVACDGAERCRVNVRIGFSLIGGMPGVPDVSTYGTIKETWINIDGGWYILPSRSG